MTDRLAAVRGSAAWAAWGDALGFITELADEGGVKHRTGDSGQVDGLVPWRRKVGGRMGVSAKFPAGAYSDDTQLRLAVSRCIRDDGAFDVEVFAKVEVATWLNYALGAGRGSKAAAASLTRADAHWNQNIFINKDADYTNIGGNGAAMRIQPHVWSAPNLDDLSSLLNRVVRDAVCTHGSPVGILGAAIHALSLAWTLRFGELPTPQSMLVLAERLKLLPEVIAADEELGGIWLYGWEQAAKRSFLQELEKSTAEAVSMGIRLSKSLDAAKGAFADDYPRVLKEIGGFDDATRGSGVVTAWMAIAACYIDKDPARSLIAVANTLGSDTDTIATMAGALTGAVHASVSPQPVLDWDVIEFEARRMAAIAGGERTTSRSYPDLMTWNLRRPVVDYVGIAPNGELALAGHGPLTDVDEPESAGRRDAPTLYRWARTPSGQHVYVRHRANPAPLPTELLPPDRPARPDSPTNESKVATPPSRSRDPNASRAAHNTPMLFDLAPDDKSAEVGHPHALTVDDALRLAIESDLRADVIGTLLLRLAQAPDDGLDRAAVFAALVVHQARQRPR